MPHPFRCLAQLCFGFSITKKQTSGALHGGTALLFCIFFATSKVQSRSSLANSDSSGDQDTEREPVHHCTVTSCGRSRQLAGEVGLPFAALLSSESEQVV